MKVFSINSVPYGSTARIMYGIAKTSQIANINHITSTGFSTHPISDTPKDNVAIGGVFDKASHMLMSIFSGYDGIFSKRATKKLLNEISKYRPDIIHLHNIHGWYLNLPMLFNYIKKNRISVVWTLHDCWAFTGKCPHFSMEKCEKWKDGCYECPNCREYPQSLVDRSKNMWKKKREWFTNVPNLTIVTPSQWLADLVKHSFLKEYPVKVINNGIDLTQFYPRNTDIKAKLHIENRKMILGVSLEWGKRKGLDIFIELSRRLTKDYVIVLVGINEKTAKKIPDSIIAINRTQDVSELAEFYSAADVFVNPTREDNFPTVNIEAIACGTPVLTFQTGGSSEMLDEKSGLAIKVDDIDALEKEIVCICEEHRFSSEDCVKRAKQFDMKNRFTEYVNLYTSK